MYVCAARLLLPQDWARKVPLQWIHDAFFGGEGQDGTPQRLMFVNGIMSGVCCVGWKGVNALVGLLFAQKELQDRVRTTVGVLRVQ